MNYLTWFPTAIVSRITMDMVIGHRSTVYKVTKWFMCKATNCMTAYESDSYAVMV